ncbi:MAG: alpha/beta hydrolase [Betaproteobacteria bacterium]|nr:alpha/beta hydrolase [Betaproteobacteria bacterium]
MNVFRLAAALVVAAWATAACAQAPAPDATTFDVGTLRVERHGERGSPVILIPGLASGAWVWNDSLAALRASHRVYTVTLAGFDGRPAVPGDPLALAADALRELIVSQRLERPVVVGHSLGGMLALMLAAAHPELVGGVVTVDGMPVFPGTENTLAADRGALADRFRRQFSGLSPAGFEALQLQYMRSIGVIDEAKAAAAARLAARSDPQAVADYAGAVVALDLRPQLPRIRVPVLAVVPWYAPDLAGTGFSQAGKVAYYRSLLTGVAQLELVAIAPARHFVMLDQPQAFIEALTAFLAAQAGR